VKSAAIIVAGGSGSRMGKPKQFLALAEKTVVEWSLGTFLEIEEIEKIILVMTRRTSKRTASAWLPTASCSSNRARPAWARCATASSTFPKTPRSWPFTTGRGRWSRRRSSAPFWKRLSNPARRCRPFRSRTRSRK